MCGRKQNKIQSYKEDFTKYKCKGNLVISQFVWKCFMLCLCVPLSLSLTLLNSFSLSLISLIFSHFFLILPHSLPSLCRSTYPKIRPTPPPPFIGYQPPKHHHIHHHYSMNLNLSFVSRKSAPKHRLEEIRWDSEFIWPFFGLSSHFFDLGKWKSNFRSFIFVLIQFWSKLVKIWS